MEIAANRAVLSMMNELVFFRTPDASRRGPRVLHIGPLPPPWGGLAANLKYLLESKALSTFDTAVLNTAQRQFREDVNPVKKIWHFRRVRKALRIFADARRAVRQFRPHIVHIHSAGDDLSAIRDMLLILVCSGGSRRVVFQEFFWPDPAKFTGPRGVFSFFYKRLIPRAAAVLMGTPLHVELASPRIDVSRAHYLPTTCVPGSTLDLSHRAARSGKCRVAYVGRLSRLKGTYDLIAAIVVLIKSSRDFVFVLVGVGATERDDDEVKRLIAEHKLDEHVVLTGRVSDEEKWRILSESDLMVFPSLGEQFGVTVLEGLAAGLPVVTTSVDYLPRLILHGENGLIVPPADPTALAKALLTLGKDREMRVRMGRANRAKFEGQFAVEVIAGKLRTIYESLLQPASAEDLAGTESRPVDTTVRPRSDFS